jgi:outer membrane receptor protein involved in Fe transport
MKKHLIICIGFFIPILSGYTQNIYTGKVIDEHKKPIIGATIIAIANLQEVSTTGKNGAFYIKHSKVQVSAIGFVTKKIHLTPELNTIILYEAIENLDEIIISASREIQKRKEVPAAIGLLTSQQINRTKAIGIEQLVNQVSGVFMSTSKASGNEQHFMATRSPISTKSLFLYVEDGLPIRPVAVFNHNALLEMNSTTFNRVEVLKGPASSIYGSEAIGGSFNFITKDPRKEFGGDLGIQINDLGLTRYEAETSTTINKKYGFYIGSHYVQRNNGPVGHSDYEKFAVTFKNKNLISANVTWTNVLTFIEYRSDMSGSISEQNYSDGNYESNQTFTERAAKSLRIRSTLDKIWNSNNKTSFNIIFRDNEMAQIPSYRIRQHRINGQLNGTGTGETNSNGFKSYAALVQHKTDFSFANSSLITGVTTDFSPQKYVAEKIDVTVDANQALNTGYTKRTGDYILNYDANLLNVATYVQYEISPIENFKITGAIRYDHFSYDYDNKIEVLSGVKDTKVIYSNVSPKLGINYNFSRNSGIYSNYSQGFTPPQTSTLFRNSKNNSTGDTVFDLSPATFNNYEIGGYFSIPSKLKVDLALYQLDGINRLISIRDSQGEYVQKNVGKTQSRGIELGIKYTLFKNVSINYNGSYASHRYIDFFDNNVDYSNTNMQSAPNYIANIAILYKPFTNFDVSLEYEQIGEYATSFEGQAIIGEDLNGDDITGTSTYNGHSIFNLRATYKIKNIELWVHSLNLFNELYAVRASYSAWDKENTYNTGNPLAFHFGVKYHF